MSERRFRPDLDELLETVARMERRLRDDASAEVLRAYEAVAARFAADLADDRDVLLSRSAALMLVQELVARQRRDERPDEPAGPASKRS